MLFGAVIDHIHYSSFLQLLLNFTQMKDYWEGRRNLPWSNHILVVIAKLVSRLQMHSDSVGLSLILSHAIRLRKLEGKLKFTLESHTIHIVDLIRI